MAKLAVLFAGQGAQSVGMGKDIAEASPAAAEVYSRANEVVGYDLRQICFEGPDEKLEQTDIQQPAIFVTSVAIWEALREKSDVERDVVAMAGLSLGEYTALHAAGSLSFEDGLRLVQRRGELMQAASASTPGGMVTALGLEKAQVESICQEAASAGALAPANYNCPGQIVLSGDQAGCRRAASLIEAAGGRAVMLKVAGAFHSSLMQAAADGLAGMLARTPFTTPRTTVLANVNCQNHGPADIIRRWLAEQLTRPVEWEASMEKLLGSGVEQFIEVGPGRVLTGLMRKISRDAVVMNVSTSRQLDQVAERVA